MKTMLFALAALFLSVSLLAGPCPDNMTGEVKTSVDYIPLVSPKQWNERFPHYVAEHLKFLIGQMQAGNLESAGPFLLGNDTYGGQAIYRGGDAEKAKATASHDPLVKNGLVKLVARPWLKCRLK